MSDWRPYRAPSCEGLGDVHTRFKHQLTCMEVACDLRYVAADYDWGKVVRSYRRRGESLDGNERAAKRVTKKVRKKPTRAR